MPKRAVDRSPSVEISEDGADDDKRSNEGSDGGEEEEYEIEKIVDHKVGQYVKGQVAYFVKWKGYPDSDNSFVSKEDAGGAQDMIQEYWDTKPNHKDNPANKKRANRPKTSGGGGSRDTPVISQKELDRKRRDAKAAKTFELNNVVDMDTDDDEAPRPKKKQRTSELSTSNGKNKEKDEKPVRKATASDQDLASKLSKKLAAKAKKVVKDGSEEEEAPEQSADLMAVDMNTEPGSMKPYMHIQSWEHIVKTVQTVEKAEDDTLKVYFVIRRPEDGMVERVSEDTTICNQKFPQKLLDFYESHLRWRATDDPAPEYLS
ncbi:hypothetical protein BKA62DRAFT_346113 [Auriculariales sp. MPI-PUGE-AT-0066]|nr:hypothetical protein BKA62DRAFT_346113 [Auriculariales sp. MPI-PUGE-AT-0066]